MRIFADLYSGDDHYTLETVDGVRQIRKNGELFFTCDYKYAVDWRWEELAEELGLKEPEEEK